MGTLSFSQVAATILASVSTGNRSSNTTNNSSAGRGGVIMTSGPSANNESSLSQFSLKGKLDLSLWRDIGNDDDDDDEEEEEDNDVEDNARLSRRKDDGLSSPQPPPSPILAPLLPTKEKGAKSSSALLSPNSVVPSHARPMSPRLMSAAAASKSEEVGVSKDNDGKKAESTTWEGATIQSLSSPTTISLDTRPVGYYATGKKKAIIIIEEKSGGSSCNNGNSSRRAQAVSREEQGTSGSSPVVVDSIEKPQEEQEQEQQQEQQQQLPPISLKSPLEPSSTRALLSAFIGSSGLLRNPQFQSGKEREKSEKSRRVEFLMDSEAVSKEQQQQIQDSQAKQKEGNEQNVKKSGSPKGGNQALIWLDGRSRSGSAAARRPSAKPPTTDILQEIRKMSLASQDALEEKKKMNEALGTTSGGGGGRRFGKKKVKRRKAEEVFTDKDRAAAVTLGSKDIKQSLKAKKKRDRKMRLSISFLSGEEYVIGTLLGEASYQMRVKKQPDAALQTLNKALEIQPNHKGALVARSQCYLKLGDAESALEDAKLAWDPSNPNDNYIQGLYQYAEALYQLGEFEKALIAFHRGHRSRKDMDGFRIGIQKCQEAIKRAIGHKSATSIPNLDQVLPLIQELEYTKARLSKEEEDEEGAEGSVGDRKKRVEEDDTNLLKSIAKYRIGENSSIRLSSPAESKVKSRLISRELMGQLSLDKAYLKKFVNRPEVINQQGLAKGLRDEASDALKYLEGRERFWRQQNPLYSRKNFQTMLKAHAHDVACREKSVSEDPSIAKYLERRGSVITTSASMGNGDGRSGSCSVMKRQSSEPRLKMNSRKKSDSIDRNHSSERVNHRK